MYPWFLLGQDPPFYKTPNTRWYSVLISESRCWLHSDWINRLHGQCSQPSTRKAKTCASWTQESCEVCQNSSQLWQVLVSLGRLYSAYMGYHPWRMPSKLIYRRTSGFLWYQSQPDHSVWYNKGMGLDCILPTKSKYRHRLTYEKASRHRFSFHILFYRKSE